MTPALGYLNEKDHAAFRTMVAFLKGRLAESETLDWALRLKQTQRIERLAIETLLNGLEGRSLDEPWATAWQLMEENWIGWGSEDDRSATMYDTAERLRGGDRSGVIIANIVNLVAPRLKVEPLDDGHWQFIKRPRKPRAFEHLLSAKLTSGNLLDLNILGLAQINDTIFLESLGSALEAAVIYGLRTARRLGWDGRQIWPLGDLGRVYYTAPNSRQSGDNDPDSYNRGIAPSVKLLYAVVERISQMDITKAQSFIKRWKIESSLVHTRLWAAMARNPELVDTEEVNVFLVGLSDYFFWDVSLFPEIAELRALRFRFLDRQAQSAIARRLRRGPPRSHWPRKADPDRVKNVQFRWAVRELKRLEVGGGVLPPTEREWLFNNISQLPDLAEMRLDEGFPEPADAFSFSPIPDEKYNTLSGVTRLRTLEDALSTSQGGWPDNPADRASDWLRRVDSALFVLDDIESVGNGADDFPFVWERFGWAHSPQKQDSPESLRRDLQAEADRVLVLINELSVGTLAHAIRGISAWLYSWRVQVVTSTFGLSVWLRVWPIAVEATEAEIEADNDMDLSFTGRSEIEEGRSKGLDTLNSPAGKLVGVFLIGCPSLDKVPRPFSSGTGARQMRDAVIGADGRSGLIARHRLIEGLPYFLRADQNWTERELIAPLLSDDQESLILWRAIARRIHSTEILKIIGDPMTRRATDLRLGRDTRRNLVYSLVIEELRAFREEREPAIPKLRIQQMLRALDDEVRASAAKAIQQFVRDLSAELCCDGTSRCAADLFCSAAAPFIREVWPQERSLSTPGVSRAFAALPSTSGEAFAEAVAAVERFLVPFDCWSMVDYGLHGEDEGEKRLDIINSESRAKALLRLLDLTIGSAESAVIPHDLTKALDQIRFVAPELTRDSIYRRLATAARR